MSSDMAEFLDEAEWPTLSQSNPASGPISNISNDQRSAPSSAGVSAPPTPSSSQQPVTPRRRRLFSRLSRSGFQGRNISTALDPEALDFLPAARTPSKRKASASSAKSGKTVQAGSRTLAGTLTSIDHPIIKSKDVLGAVGPDRYALSTASTYGMLDSSSDDELEFVDRALQSAQSPNRPMGRPRDFHRQRTEALATANDEVVKAENSPQKLSAVLISSDGFSRDANAIVGQNTQACHARYLPLCPASTPGSSGRSGSTTNALLTILPRDHDRIRRFEVAPDRDGAQWPLDELPVELFDIITSFLSRDDVQNMRLVNTEFERKVSRSLFHTSVVPFNTELYDMIDEDTKSLTRIFRSSNKAKGKMKAMSQDHVQANSNTDVGGLQWQNAKEDHEGKVYKGHGLRVFQGFGPHIKRFGMSFEISEKQLARPPVKKELDHVESYHGAYDWPSLHYARFANLAGLETTADETSRMKAAFANLEIVQELGLSIDSGLGWLNGPDKSVRGRIFERPTTVFGNKYDVPDRSMRSATEFWNALQQSQTRFAPESNLKEITLEYQPLPGTAIELDGIRGDIYSETQRWSCVDSTKIHPTRTTIASLGFGVLYTTARHLEAGETESSGLTLIPSQLKKEQKEWLLETQWAQQAFLESYMLAVIDNPANFAKVTSLNVAKLSSRFLPTLAREVFWDALPCLADVVLHVSPDWRNVEKDDAGLATTKYQNPSEAVRSFYKDILRDHISLKDSIKKLDIGWFGGGEHAEGMHARNANILPAPITSLEHSTANSSDFGLVFRYVEHLTLSNCWITPPVLEALVKSHSSKALKRITLESVSLTAHPRFPPVHGQGGGVQQLAQAMVAMQAQLANNAQAAQHPQLQLQPHIGLGQQAAQLGPAFLNGLQGLNAHQLAMMHQQWNQHMQQMQQFFNANPNAPNGGPNAPVQIAAVPNVGQLQPQPAPNTNPSATVAPRWAEGHREGSWPQLLDVISPGLVFDDYLPPRAPWDEPLPPRPDTKLRKIEFKSCGYAKLPHHTGFEQFVLEPEPGHGRTMSSWFRLRWATLKPLMQETRDRYLGQIVQYMPPSELDALQFGWGLVEGWNDREKAEEAEFDGLLRGGTGRFSGDVTRGMALIGQPETPRTPTN